jgi:hypothetical protein
MPFWRFVKRWTTLLTFLSLAGGVPYGIWQYQSAKAREAELLVKETYNSLDREYIEFEKLCLQYPRLDCYDKPTRTLFHLSAVEVIQQKLLYNVLLSILERAFLACKAGGFDGREQQWLNWDGYTSDFLRRKTFNDLWLENRDGFDAEFGLYMTRKNTALDTAVTCPQAKGLK